MYSVFVTNSVCNISTGCEYIVSTYTGDKFGAGTDANVIVSLFGEGGETGEFTLDNKGDNFESGK